MFIPHDRLNRAKDTASEEEKKGSAQLGPNSVVKGALNTDPIGALNVVGTSDVEVALAAPAHKQIILMVYFSVNMLALGWTWLSYVIFNLPEHV